MYSRRAFGKVIAAAVPVVPVLLRGSVMPQGESRVNGVRMGVQSASFTFSGMGLDDIITTMVTTGLREVDMMAEHVEQYLGAPGVQLPGTGRQGPWARRGGAARGSAPGGTAREGGPGAQGRGRGAGGGRGADPAARQALRDWRLGVDLDRYAVISKRFRDAGLHFFSYNLSFNDSYTDEEIEKGLLMTKALGTRIMTVSSPLSVFPRVAPLAEKHDVVVALHNHTTGPDAFAHVAALSPNFWFNLDVGHYFASGHDPLAFIRQHHGRITNLHVKDRMGNSGPEMPFGEGETPLAETLRLVRDEKYDMPVCIEYVGPDGPVAELTRCFDYCKAVLRG